MFKNFFTLLSLFLSIVVFSQKNYWSATNNVASKNLKERRSMPNNYKLYNLNLEGIEDALSNAPQRLSNDESLVLKFPTANGQMKDYVVQEASVMEPELQAKYPGIRSYVGYQKDNAANTVRFSVTPTDGVNAMYFDGWNVSYLDSYTSDNSTYIVYKRKDLEGDKEDFTCGFVNEEDNGFNQGSTYGLREPVVKDGKFRTYRLALACTTQYATYHVNRAGLQSGTKEQKKEAVLAAMAVAMTRVNGIYEKTFSLTMVMIADNHKVVFIEAGDYPSGMTYTNNDGPTMLTQNKNILNNVIGSDNFDIGHVFSTGGGGIAQLNSPCGTNKAMGVTGLPQPINDAFYVDFVCHEMGHQFGANHTFNGTTDNCGGGNKNNSTAYEPGSGSTIMGYAGICGVNNIQSNSDPYFHAISINEINTFMTRTTDCSAKVDNNNQVPTADAGADYTIPYGTPFALTGTGTDPDGDPLTYLWEQMDRETSTQPPVATATGGPVFRSYLPTESPVRYFPKMTYVLSNNMAYQWEMVPAVQRTLNFRLTVSDNKATGAQSARDDMQITVADAGPFRVTSHTFNTEYTGGTNTTVVWSVGGTSIAPISTSQVQILLSKDGGNTFDTVLANSVSNIGFANVALPNEDIANARIMIKAVGNIFFAVNSSPFKVKKFLAVNDINNKKVLAVYPNPAKGEVTISLSKKGNNTDYSIYDLSGKLVKSGKLPASEKLSVAELSTGVYRLVVSDDGETHSQNLIIKK